VTAKRRLPVLQAPADPGDPVRPPWQWSLFGAALIVLLWLALALAASPLSTHILRANVGSWSSPEDLAARLDVAAASVLARVALENLALHAAIVGVASFTAGLVLGMWSPRRGLVEAASAGALVAACAVVAATFSGGASLTDASTVAVWGSAVLVPLASGLAALGAWMGDRRKRPLGGP